jgi:plasmid stabilization system protein ParE
LGEDPGEEVSYTTRPQVDLDLIDGREWIARDNPAAADAFIDAARETFERLSQFPEFGPLARFRNSELADVRFTLVSPPFQRWLVFYRVTGGSVDIGRVIYGARNWREEPERFF